MAKVKVNNAWKEVEEIYVKVNNNWEPLLVGYQKMSNEWKEFYNKAVESGLFYFTTLSKPPVASTSRTIGTTGMDRAFFYMGGRNPITYDNNLILNKLQEESTYAVKGCLVVFNNMVLHAGGYNGNTEEGSGIKSLLIWDENYTRSIMYNLIAPAKFATATFGGTTANYAIFISSGNPQINWNPIETALDENLVGATVPNIGARFTESVGISFNNRVLIGGGRHIYITYPNQINKVDSNLLRYFDNNLLEGGLTNFSSKIQKPIATKSINHVLFTGNNKVVEAYNKSFVKISSVSSTTSSSSSLPGSIGKYAVFAGGVEGGLFVDMYDENLLKTTKSMLSNNYSTSTPNSSNVGNYMIIELGSYGMDVFKYIE